LNTPANPRWVYFGPGGAVVVWAADPHSTDKVDIDKKPSVFTHRPNEVFLTGGHLRATNQPDLNPNLIFDLATLEVLRMELGSTRASWDEIAGISPIFEPAVKSALA
jgi:hypothetical protein